jgi:hypothetical protein
MVATAKLVIKTAGELAFPVSPSNAGFVFAK